LFFYRIQIYENSQNKQINIYENTLFYYNFNDFRLKNRLIKMECLYLEDFSIGDLTPTVPGQEQKHLKALRIKNGEEILVTNGKGLVALCRVSYDKNWNPSLEVKELYENYGEIKFNFSLWVCNLHHKDRLETIVEKATELGAVEVFIPICQYSQTNKIDLIRLNKIAVSAMKQSRRANLLKLTPIFDLNLKEEIFNKFKYIILLDENGEKPLNTRIEGDTLILVGPEGGFHQDELDQFGIIPNLQKWYLGPRRLRTETAAIKALSILTSMNE